MNISVLQRGYPISLEHLINEVPWVALFFETHFNVPYYFRKGTLSIIQT